MDLYCQKCCKQLELDDSLLDIDTSLFYNQEINNIIKQLEPFTLTLPKEREIEIFKQQQLQQQQQQLEQEQLAATQSPPQPNQSKFFKNVFSKKKDNITNISTSVPANSSLQQQHSTANLLQNSQTGTTNTNIATTTPIGVNKSSTNTTTATTTTATIDDSSKKSSFKSGGVNSGSSPSSPSNTFGSSLSQHRISASLSSRSLQNNNNTTTQNTVSSSLPKDQQNISATPPQSSINNNNNNNDNNNNIISTSPSNNSKIMSPTMNKSTNKMSPSNITSPSLSTSSSKQSTPRQRPTTMAPNKINISQVTSPQKPKLKYLRSSSKSLSMASLPNVTSDELNSTNNLDNNNNYLSQSTIPIGSPIQTTPPLLSNHSNSLPNNQSNLNLSINNNNNNNTSATTTTTLNNSNSNNNLMNLNNSLVGNENNYLKYMKGLSLFKITTELTHYDLPLCLECTKLTITELEDETSILDGEISIYQSYLNRLTKQKTNEQIEQIERELLELEQEEQTLRQFIQDTYKEREDVEQLTDQLQDKRQQLKSLEDGYWSSFSELHYETFKNQEEREQTAVQIQWINEHLESLKQTNILNDAFHLWHDGHFGTINSLRLGKLPSQPVEWNEINAAWGLAIFLLDNMAKKLRYKFKQYTLVPNGSCSRIEKKDDPSAASYELFGSNDISLGRLFWYRRFDSGMVAFLHCIKELVDHIIEKDPEFTIPYQIEKDLINGTPIKMQFTNDDTWTKSLKYMLTDLKWILVWVTKNDSQLSLQQQQKLQQQQQQQQQQQNGINKK